jgi:branched-chain amino acid transport system ATP-binding protein
MSAHLKVTKLVKRYGGLLATNELELELQPGELHALIGPNGAGKTTIMKQLTGEIGSDSGDIEFDGHSIMRWSAPKRALNGIARSYQITQLLPGFTVLENVAMMVQARQGHSFRIWHPVASDPSLLSPALHALDQVGLANRAHDDVMALAHGEHRQLELAMAMAMKPRLLLLDEPLAGMSQMESSSMVSLLQTLKRNYTILLVEHDMQAVFSLADRVSVLVYGAAVANGTPEDIQNNPAVKSAYLGD